MPESTVGKLNAQLRADIAAFTANMKAAAFASEGFANQMTAAGQKFSEAGVRFSATNKLVAEFNGILDKRRAEEYAAAVEKIGGAARLTEADQAKVNRVMADALGHYKALGETAPAHLQAIEKATRQSAASTELLGGSVGKLIGAFTAANIATKVVDGLLQLGQAAIQDASKFVDLNKATGISIDTLQRMAYVAAQTGTTVDAFADIVFKLGVNVQKGGIETRQAIEQMGYSWQQFRAMKPEEQFKAIIDNQEKFGSITERNYALVKLFGKGVGETIPGIVDDYTRLAAQARVAGDEQVKALSAASNAWSAFVADTKTNLTSLLGTWVLEAKLLKTDFLEVMKGEIVAPDFTKFITQLKEARDALDSFGKHAKDFGKDVELPVIVPPTLTQALAAARTELAGLTADKLADIRAGIAINKTNDEIAKSTGASTEAIELYKKKLQDQKEAATKAEAASKKLREEIEAFHRELAAKTYTVTAMITNIGGIVKAMNAGQAATLALAEANRALSPALQKAIRDMIDGGLSASEVFRKLKELGQVTDEDRLAVERFGGAYERLEKQFAESASNAGGLGKLIGTLPKLTLHLNASVAATIAADEAHRKLAPDVEEAARTMLGLGMSADKVFESLKASGTVTDADKDKILALAKAHDTLDKSLAALTHSFAELAQVSGGAFAGVAQSIAMFIGTIAAGVQAGTQFKAALANLRTENGKSIEGYTQLATSAMGAVSAIGAATSTGSAGHRALSGAATGAAIGTKILPGWGTAVGAAVGAIVGAIRGSKSNAYKLGQEWGVTFSDGLQKTIDDEKKSLFKGDLDAAALHNLKAIIAEAGGLTEKNLAFYERKLLDVFVKLSQGAMTAAQATQVLNDNFADFLKAGTDASGLWDANLRQIVQAAQDAHLEVQAISDAIAGQQQTLAGATVGLTAATGAQAARYTELKATLDAATKSLADLVAKGAEQTEITAATEAVTKAQQDLAGVTVTSQEEFDRLSRISLAAFTGLVASGVDVVAAMAQIGPGIDNLIASAQAFGLSGNDAFDQLSRWRELTKTNEALLTQIGSLNDIMVTLANLGSLSADTFTDLEAQGSAAFDKLTAAGFTENEALVQMKPYLETILKLHKERGFAIDDATQKLIAQAEAQGILTDEQLSTNNILIDIGKAMYKLIGEDIPEAWKKTTTAAQTSAEQSTAALKKTGQAGEEAARRTETAWNQVEITVPVKFDLPGVPESSGSTGPSPSPASAANEGFFRMPRTIRVGDDPFSEGEFVLHKRTLERLVSAAAAMGTRGGADLSAALATLPAPIAFPPTEVLAGAAPPVLTAMSAVPPRGGGGGTVIVMLDRRFLAQAIVPELEGEVRRLGFAPR